MLRKYLDYSRIKKEYKFGDGFWLEEINRQVNKIETENIEELNRISDVQDLLVEVYRILNFTVYVNEKDYMSDLFEITLELYSLMKIKLTEMLGIEFMWEEL